MRKQVSIETGYWKLEHSMELEQEDLEHISVLVLEGFTEGQLLHIETIEEEED